MVCSLDPSMPVIADADTGYVPIFPLRQSVINYLPVSEAPRTLLVPLRNTPEPVSLGCTSKTKYKRNDAATYWASKSCLARNSSCGYVLR
jgi:hypothetical protein